MLQHACCSNGNKDSSAGKHSLHTNMRCICQLVHVSNVVSCLLARQSVAYIRLGVKGAAHGPQCGHSLLYICLQSTGQRQLFCFSRPACDERQSCKGNDDGFALEDSDWKAEPDGQLQRVQYAQHDYHMATHLCRFR